MDNKLIFSIYLLKVVFPEDWKLAKVFLPYSKQENEVIGTIIDLFQLYLP